MGQSFNKDKRVEIYAQVNKQVYKAGQEIMGSAHLRVKTQIEYDALYVKIKCQQQSNCARRQQMMFVKPEVTYQDQFIIQKYEGGIVEPGNYTIPFAFVLPRALPGSFHIKGFKRQYFMQIKYTLMVYLACYSKRNQNQLYQIPLNIRQLPKIPKSIVKSSEIIENKGCCIGKGITMVHLTCDKNIVTTGERIRVDVSIDNTKGSTQISHFNLLLVQREAMRQLTNLRKKDVSTPYQLIYQPKTIVESGEIKNLVFDLRIPRQIAKQTSVGQNNAIWFQFKIIVRMGTCNHFQFSNLKIFVYSKAQVVSKVEKPKLPQLWDAIVYPTIFYQGIKPYIYMPSRYIQDFLIYDTSTMIEYQQLNNIPNLADMQMRNRKGYKPSFRNDQKNPEDDPYQSNVMLANYETEKVMRRQ